MRKRALPKALWKPQLLMGCESIPWIIVALLSAVIVYGAQTWLLRFAGLFFGLILIFIIRKINKNEPHAFKIIMRYALYQKYYLNVAKYPSSPSLYNNIDR